MDKSTTSLLESTGCGVLANTLISDFWSLELGHNGSFLFYDIHFLVTYKSPIGSTYTLISCASKNSSMSNGGRRAGEGRQLSFIGTRWKDLG